MNLSDKDRKKTKINKKIKTSPSHGFFLKNYKFLAEHYPRFTYIKIDRS